MSDEERVNMARALGVLEGRMTALESDVTGVKASIKAMDEKLDAIMAKLNQSMGGLKAGTLFATVTATIASAIWAVWSHFAK